MSVADQESLISFQRVGDVFVEASKADKGLIMQSFRLAVQGLMDKSIFAAGIYLNAAVVAMYAVFTARPPQCAMDVVMQLQAVVGVPTALVHVGCGIVAFLFMAMTFQLIFARNILLEKAPLHWGVEGSFTMNTAQVVLSFYASTTTVGIVLLVMLFLGIGSRVLELALMLVPTMLGAVQAFFYTGLTTLLLEDSSAQVRDLVDRIAGLQNGGKAAWLSIAQDHYKLRGHLCRWRLDSGRLMVTNLAVNFAVGLPMMVFMLDPRLQLKGQLIATIGFTWSGIAALRKLLEAAGISDSCQLRAMGTESCSLLQLANDKYCTLPEGEDRDAAFQFCHYLTNTPTGIQLPLLGLITTSFIKLCIKGLVTFSSASAIFVLRQLGERLPAPGAGSCP